MREKKQNKSKKIEKAGKGDTQKSCPSKVSIKGRPAKTEEGRVLENNTKDYSTVIAKLEFYTHNDLEGLYFIQKNPDINTRFQKQILIYQSRFQNQSKNFQEIVNSYLGSLKSMESPIMSGYSYGRFTDRDLLNKQRLNINNIFSTIDITYYMDIYLFIIAKVSNEETLSAICTLFSQILTSIRQGSQQNKNINFEQFFNPENVAKMDDSLDIKYTLAYKLLYDLMKASLLFFNLNLVQTFKQEFSNSSDSRLLSLMDIQSCEQEIPEFFFQ